VDLGYPLRVDFLPQMFDRSSAFFGGVTVSTCSVKVE
jgi:hypothetical protein